MANIYSMTRTRAADARTHRAVESALKVLVAGFRSHVAEVADRFLGETTGPDNGLTIREVAAEYLDAIEEAAQGLREEAGLRARRTSGGAA